ncbi:MAG TPA: hypothetical protein DCL44_01820 [Elusimicrobia bacterium]|nr:hypothetical protein [Elusimicrobiota bacterium]
MLSLKGSGFTVHGSGFKSDFPVSLYPIPYTLILSCLLFLCAFSLPALAYDKNELAELNDMYKNGKYQEALDGYLKMTQSESENPYTFYNAGNAYFRLNRPGFAVLYYAKAFKLLPRDPDMRANLDYALKQTGQALVPDGVPKALHYVYYLLSDLELKALAIIFFWLACFAGALRALAGEKLKEELKTAPYATAAACLFFLLWIGVRDSSPFTNGAVAAAPATLLSGPGEKFKANATLPEARLVKILDEGDEEYYEIGLPGEGIKGWVKKTDLQKI